MKTENDIQVKLGKIIRSIRGDMTSAKAAESIGISQGHLSKIEQGKIVVRKNLLLKIIEIFQVAPTTSRIILAYAGYSTREILPHFSKKNKIEDEEIYYKFFYENSDRMRMLCISAVPSQLQIPEYKRNLLRVDWGNKEYKIDDVDLEKLIAIHKKCQKFYREQEIETQVILLDTLFSQQVLMPKKVFRKQIEYIKEQIKENELLTIRLLLPSPNNIIPMSNFFINGEFLLIAYHWYWELMVKQRNIKFFKLFEKTFNYFWHRCLSREDSYKRLTTLQKNCQ